MPTVKSKKKLLDDKIEFQFKVPSKSKMGSYHFVTCWKDGTIYCDCEAWLFGNKLCRHILIAEKWLDLHGNPTNNKK